jgi:hypothetical protein
VVIAEDKVNLRTGPGTSFPVETWVASHEKVIPLEKVAGWTRVRTASGRVGFIHDSLLAYAAPQGAVAVATPPGARTARPVPTRPRMARSMTPPAHQTVTVPAVSPTPDTPPLDERRGELLSEVASLRTEIEELKRGLAEREAAEAARSEPQRSRDEPLLVSTPSSLASPVNASEGSDRSVRTLSVAIVSLGIGWVLGATLSRRRTRNQKNRLRL